MSIKHIAHTSDQGPMYQATGHSASLQARFRTGFSICLQNLFLICSLSEFKHFSLRFCTPPPQGSLQTVHSPVIHLKKTTTTKQLNDTILSYHDRHVLLKIYPSNRTSKGLRAVGGVLCSLIHPAVNPRYF